MGRQDSNGPYLGTREGFVMLTLTSCLSVLSFMTVVDREPSQITRGNSSTGGTSTSYTGNVSFACGNNSPFQGLFVVPGDACFPLGITGSIESLVPVLVVLVILVTFSVVAAQGWQSGLPDWDNYRWVLILLFGALYAGLNVIDILVISGYGIDIAPDDDLVPNVTYLLVFMIHILFVSTPVWVYVYPLLPERISDTRPKDALRSNLHLFIDANWRRARLLTTLSLTGAVGIALAFVFSRASPNFFFVLAIVGSVTISPLGIVWFLMRRIREAEKELRST